MTYIVKRPALALANLPARAVIACFGIKYCGNTANLSDTRDIYSKEMTDCTDVLKFEVQPKRTSCKQQMVPSRPIRADTRNATV